MGESQNRFDRSSARLAWIGLGLAGLGVAVVIVRSWIAYLDTPGIRLEDAYWTGYEPWSSLGIVLAVGGATLAILAASALVLVRGDTVRRVLLLPFLAMAAVWWAWALGIWPYPRLVGPDPVTFAFTLPQQAGIMLLIPAVAIAALAFLARRPDMRVRLRPVPREHSEAPDPTASTSRE